jgi:hypothetical protein
MTRQKGVMDMDLFKKLIDEAAALPLIDHITLTGLGEPLVDRHVYDRIRHIRKRMPAILTDIYTSGHTLTFEQIDKLRAAGLSVLYISLNAVTGEKRKAVMKVDDFDKVCDAADYAIEQYNEHGGMKVIVKAVCSKDLFDIGDAEKFILRWNGKTENGGNAFLHLEGNWAGAVWPMRAGPQLEPCSRALQQIMVLWDGRVSLCCFDGSGKEILGDTRTHTIKEIFNAPKATGIREAHWQGRRDTIPLCATCTAI